MHLRFIDDSGDSDGGCCVCGYDMVMTGPTNNGQMLTQDKRIDPKRIQGAAKVSSALRLGLLYVWARALIV